MKKWSEEELIAAGYIIKNAKITSVDLSMEDHGILICSIVLDGGGWGCVYGGYAIGHGFLGANEFKGSAIGLEAIMRIMDVVGVSNFNDMKDKYIRVATSGWGETIKIIGNIIKDNWFDVESFFDDEIEEVVK